jgi:hypothetical protein
MMFPAEGTPPPSSPSPTPTADADAPPKKGGHLRVIK